MNSMSLLNVEKVEINKTKFKNKYEYIKSNNILRKILNFIQKERQLEILKYNKFLQQRLNLNINDYKEYSEIFSSIEIEIIPEINIFGEFINIENESDKKYFHIYFNEGTSEIKTTKIKMHEEVSKIKIIIDYQIKSFNKLFSNCICINSINIKKFHRNNISDMSNIFSGCSSLKELNIRTKLSKGFSWLKKKLKNVYPFPLKNKFCFISKKKFKEF